MRAPLLFAAALVALPVSAQEPPLDAPATDEATAPAVTDEPPADPSPTATPDDEAATTTDDEAVATEAAPVPDAPDVAPTTTTAPDVAPSVAPPPVDTAPDTTKAAEEKAPAATKPAAKAERDDDQAALNALLGPGAAAGAKSYVFRGSTLSFQTQATALSLWPSAEPTYNPTVVANIGVNPVIWFGNTLNITGYVEVNRELTNSDSTTYAGELELSDLFLSARATNFYSIPFVDVGLSAAGTVILPTSKVSWAQTQLVGVELNGTAIRVFNLLSGLVVGYQLRGGKGFHRYTTGETASSLEEGRCFNLQYCGVWASNGVRNVEWTMQNRLFMQWGIFDWLGIFVDGRTIHQWLYPQQHQDPRVSFNPADPAGKYGTQHMRYLTGIQTAVFVTPHPAVTFFVGTSTFAPQLSPGSTYYIPGVNRFAQLYASAQVNMAGVASILDD